MNDNSSNDTQTINTYSANRINFNYPGNWSTHVKSVNNTISIKSTPNYSFDTSSYFPFGPFVSNVTISSAGTQFQVKILHTAISEQDIIQMQNNALSANWKKISSNIITIGGNKAYEEIFTTDNSNGTVRYEQIDFVKSGNTYAMVFQAHDNYFDKEKQNFDPILNSLKVQ